MSFSVKKTIEAHVKRHEDYNSKYPNRFKEIHKGYCKNCPSRINKLHGIEDPESEEIKKWDKADRAYQ